MTNAYKNLIGIFAAIFVFFTFFNLNWGAPFYFHPDERNIASAVTRLDITHNLNPEFFAYGGFPIYSIYFVGLINNYLQNPLIPPEFTVAFEEAIIISRIFSAVFTILTIFLIYKTSQKVFSDKVANIALLLITSSVAFLQYSHFGTFEMWLSFFYILLFYYTLLFLEKKTINNLILLAIIFGAAVSIKISSLILIALPLFAIIYAVFGEKRIIDKIKNFIKYFITVIYFAFVFFLITNPFVFLDTTSFLNSIDYETSVATGTLQVFYTGSFINTLPVVFQFLKVLPFLINPLLTLLSFFAILFTLYISIKKRSLFFFLLVTTFLLIFVSQSVLFVKWTRYIVPSLPFLYILLAFTLVAINKKIGNKMFKIVLIFIIFFSVLFSLSFIKTVRLASDTRLAAADYTVKNLEPESLVYSEVYDMGIVPFNQYLPNIKLFNFYDLDHGLELNQEIFVSDYFISPSPRVIKSRLEKKESFPKGHKFYSDLVHGESDFNLIYSTPCDIFCKFIYMGDPIYNVEETVNIFDRPTVFIYENIKK